jgi:hypothetical protein
MTLPISYPQLAWPPAGSPLDDTIARTEHGAVMEAAAKLRLGMAQPPKVWMFIEGWDPPIVATISTRPYYRGADAVAAISALGDMPAAIAATHLLVMWNESDLRASLAGPGDHPDGLVAVRVSLEGHLLHWYPYRPDFPDLDRGLPTTIATWGTPSSHPGAPLPDPIAQLLNRWRQCAFGRSGDPAVVIPQLEAAGFVLTSIARDWAQL